MNDVSSPGHADLQVMAAQEARSLGLQILDRAWTSGPHALDVVAAAHPGTLVVVDVRDPAATGNPRHIDDISADRLAALRTAAQAWMDQHHSEFTRIRVDAAGLTRYGFVYATEVG